MVIDVNETFCGDHFAIPTYIESSCCSPETNITLYINYMFNNFLKIVTLRLDSRVRLIGLYPYVTV